MLLSHVGAAQPVLQRSFAPPEHSRWRTVSLGSTDDNPRSYDPKRMGVGADGRVHIYAKRPLAGPAQGTAVLVLRDDAAELAGPELTVDGDALLVENDGVLVGTRGTQSMRRPEVYRLQGGAWQNLTPTPLSAEVRSLWRHDGVLYAGTNGDGIYRVSAGQSSRVGVRTVIQRDSYTWTQLGDYGADMQRVAPLSGGQLVALGKDLRVRRWDGTGWADLGNVAAVTFDAMGAITGYLREPKAVVIAGGVIYVGTKGGVGAPEGKDEGAVWRWTGSVWERMGAESMKKEVTQLVALSDGTLLAGTSEAGVYRWDGTSWTARNQGITPDAGKIKAETLTVGSDGQLYVGVKNVLLRSTNRADQWTEVGFLRTGEEIKAVILNTSGQALVGVKRGDGTGAVMRWSGTEFVQVGADLPREVRSLLYNGATLLSGLGGGGGAVRLDGDQWQPITGNLSGDSTDVKQLLLAEGALYAATKAGLHKGQYSPQVSTVTSPISQREIGWMWTRDGALHVGLKQGGIWRLSPDPLGDDGQGFTRADSDLPDGQMNAFVQLETEVLAVGFQLLYKAPTDTLRFTNAGSNPGTAQLDGDGNLTYVGQSELKTALRDNGALYVGTKDGLFRSSDDGQTWKPVSGPADVKHMLRVGRTLYVAAKESVIPDPANAPTVTRDSAGVFVRDLDGSWDDGAGATASGCSMSGVPQSTSAPLVLLLGAALLTRIRRRQEPAK